MKHHEESVAMATPDQILQWLDRRRSTGPNDFPIDRLEHRVEVAAESPEKWFDDAAERIRSDESDPKGKR